MPLIDTDPKELDFGEIFAGERRSKTLKIYNRGDTELALLKVGFTCGCTIPQILLPSGEIVIPEKKGEDMIGMLQPGESAELELEFKGLGYKGKIRRKLTLHSNDAENRSLDVPILADVKPGFTFEPRRIEFGRLKKNETKVQSMVIRSTEAGPFRIQGITGLPPYLAHAMEYFDEGPLPCARLTLTLAPGAPVGPMAHKLLINIENEKIKECYLHVSANILPPVTFHIDPQNPRDILDFKVIPKGKGVEKTIRIVNDQPEVPYRILKMDFASRYTEFIDVELVEEEEGIRYSIVVKVKPEINARFFKGSITLVSDHPDLEKKKITIQGWISKE